LAPPAAIDATKQSQDWPIDAQFAAALAQSSAVALVPSQPSSPEGSTRFRGLLRT